MSFMKIYSLFETHDRAKTLPDYALALWRTLLFWGASHETLAFKASSRSLMEDAGISRDSFWGARKTLVEHGFLLVESTRGSQFARYSLADGSAPVRVSDVEEATREAGRQVSRKGGDENEGQMMQNPGGTSIQDGRVDGGQDGGEVTEKNAEQPASHAHAYNVDFCSISNSSSLHSLNQDQNLTTTTQIGPLVAHARSAGFTQVSGKMRTGLSDWMTKHAFPDRLAMAKRAIDLASEAGCFNWNYVQALLRAWEKKGFTTLKETIEEREAYFKQARYNQKTPRQRKGDRTNDTSKEAFFKLYPSADF